MSKIAVTGASGHLGRLTLDALIASGRIAAADIIAISRDTSKLADYAARGVDLRTGDFGTPETLATAFRGADRVAIISVDTFPRGELHKAAVAAAGSAGVGRVLYTSLAIADGVTPSFGADHFETEQAIKDSGLAYTILRNNWYLENLFMSLPNAIKSGSWFTSANGGRIAYGARADYAAALAGALLDDAPGNRVHTLTGPKAYTAEEVAELANAALGTSIAVVNLGDEQLAEGMKQAGVPDPVVPVLVSMDTNVRNGGLDVVTGDVETLSGKAPVTLEDFLSTNKDALLAAAQ